MRVTSTLAVTALILCACNEPPPPPPPAPPPVAVKAPPPPVEIPITTKSPQALALYKTARALFEDQRANEAIAPLKAALALDPDFAQAHLSLGMFEPGPDAAAHLDKAQALLATLPETEKLVVESNLVGMRGDAARSLELRQKLVTLAPEDWRSHFYLAATLGGLGKEAESIAPLEKALALNPKSGACLNTLGYANAHLANGHQCHDDGNRHHVD